MFDEVAGETRLVHEDINVALGKALGEVDTKEPFHDTHEIDSDKAERICWNFASNASLAEKKKKSLT